MESGYEAALDLLEKKKDIAVLSCATDTIAAGAIEGFRHKDGICFKGQQYQSYRIWR